MDQPLESLNMNILGVKSISVTQPISRVFYLAVDLPQCKMISSFVDIRYQAGLC